MVSFTLTVFTSRWKRSVNQPWRRGYALIRACAVFWSYTVCVLCLFQVEAPVLPTEFTLPVVVPTFNFGLTPATSSNSTSSAVKTVPSPAKSPGNSTNSNSDSFTFASPIAKAAPEQANGSSASSPKVNNSQVHFDIGRNNNVMG